jgi:hypothetical protein
MILTLEQAKVKWNKNAPSIAWCKSSFISLNTSYFKPGIKVTKGSKVPHKEGKKKR